MVTAFPPGVPGREEPRAGSAVRVQVLVPTELPLPMRRAEAETARRGRSRRTRSPRGRGCVGLRAERCPGDAAVNLRTPLCCAGLLGGRDPQGL